MTVEKYIAEHIGETVRLGKTDNPLLLSLPFPYTVPSIALSFQEMYYWDTYFTNKALLLCGREEQAVNNVKNFVWLVEKFGFIPNGSHEWLLNRSQPPVFALAVADVWAYLGETQKTQCLDAIKKELSFWEEKRKTPIGLARYDSMATDEECFDFSQLYAQRVGIQAERSVALGKDALAEAESGWDFSPRFPNGCTKYAAVDLNALLYGAERFLGEKEKTERDRQVWVEYAEIRKKRMRVMQDCDGVYSDLEYTKKTPSGVYSCAGFFPYFTGASQDKKGFLRLLSVLEREHGVAACLSNENRFQWSEPNGWPPLTYVCVAAALRLGEENIARRIAQKYVDTVDGCFKKYGGVFEKYDVTTGDIGLGAEYGTPQMLGWTAGTYLSFKNYLLSGTLI